nr:Inner membrane protein YjjP [Klebsiella pneumoniae]
MLTHRSMHPQINFCITAFVATTISGLLLRPRRLPARRPLPWPPAFCCWSRVFH